MTSPRGAGKAPPKKLTAGSEIDAWCTRCRLDLGHRIVAMVGSAPKRVICQTCGSEHNYRPAAGSARAGSAGAGSAGAAASSGASARKAAGGSKTQASRKDQARAEWEAKVNGGAPRQKYEPTARFAVGDVLSHPKFGEGYVRSLISPNKFTIAFSTGERTLIHAPDA